MLVPVRWLSEYVDIEGISVEALEEKLIMTGSNSEGVEHILGMSECLVMGKIEEVGKHPEADKLFIIKVRVGEELLQIVTGADNCKPGKCVAVAVHGSKIANGTKIKKGKLRNVESNGMLCSLDELGFDDKVIPKEFVDMIFLLKGDYPTNVAVKEAEPEFDDAVINFEITPNRPDCLSVIGMAREVAASFERKLTLKTVKETGVAGNAADHIKIEIESPELCPRYSARVVKNVKITESPDWMKLRLMKAGMRPINVIVDISNYVMLEMGQPTHAFDLDTLKGGKIVVRTAKPGEMMTTLDDVERKLEEDMLMITDGERAVAIAGVMGGEETEVKASTVNLLIESANFNKSNIRKTSKTLGLRSEASSRFEKGVPAALALDAVNRVCELIEELGAGEVVKGAVDVYPGMTEPKTIVASVKRINGMIGINLPANEMVALLELLSMAVVVEGDKLTVSVPSHRLDLDREIDLVEEVARLYGYDKIPLSFAKDSEWGAKTNGQIFEDVARTQLIGDGFFETLTYSFVSPRCHDMIRTDETSFSRRQVRLINPLGEEYSVMRTSLIPNAMEILARNYKFKVEEARIFEIGNLFIPKELPVTDLPFEKKSMVISAYGPNETFFTIKGAVLNLFERLGVKGVEFIAEDAHPTFHPGRCATIAIGNHIVGTVGEIHPLVTENYGIDTRVVLADIDFNLIIQMTRLDRVYHSLPKYPTMKRDVAMLVKDEVSHAEIESFILANGGKKLVAVQLFDVYKGKQIEDGYKSMAYSMTYRDNDATLTDEEINGAFKKLTAKLEEFGAKLR